ncbi:MAG: tetratricopeptide repeat protein, partial [Anaerolineae bacterium]
SYRALAQANPQAFLPDLAGSLNNLGNVLSNVGRREEALAAYEEAVRTLQPFFQAHPQAFRSWMKTMVENYRRACQALGREPHAELLKGVLPPNTPRAQRKKVGR